MAYNKITSHFSSSQTFSKTNLFIYDSATEELKTTEFYLEDESSSNTITASNNTLILTGTLDVQNDITASDIIFDGISWSSPYVVLPNFAGIIFLYFLRFKKII